MLKTTGAPRLRLTTLLAAALFGLSFAATAAPAAEPSTGAPAKTHVKKARAKAGTHAAKTSHLTAKQVKKAKATHRKAHKAVKHAPKARTGV